MSWDTRQVSAGGRAERDNEITPGVIFDALSSERRRILLSVLRDQTGSITERDLAAAVAERLDGADPDRVHTTLVHAHIPKLERAGLIRRGPDNRIALAADSPVRTPRFQMLLRTAGSWDADVGVFSDEQRREIVGALATSRGQVDLDELVEDLVSDESSDAESVRTTLHHVHLPKLDAAGVLDYDPERRLVAYEGMPSVYESWLTTDRADR